MPVSVTEISTEPFADDVAAVVAAIVVIRLGRKVLNREWL
jgi:hypothetical protein